VTREDIKEGEATYRVLSYQFHCQLQSGEQWSDVGCPDHDERISLGEFLVFALGSGIKSGAVTALPTILYLVGHFTRADVPAFSDFKDLQSILSAVRNTFVSINQFINLNIELEKDSRIQLRVHLRDTMLLSPGSTKSLAALGDLVERPKIVLGPDKSTDLYFKKNMNVLRRENWPLFREYALNDAVICVEYVQRLINQTVKATGSNKIPVTLTSIGVDLLLRSWKDKLDIERLSVLGLEKIATDKWNQKLGHYHKVIEEIPLEECAWHLDFVTETYHGGRNEQFWFGPAYDADWTDYDLSSAYPTAMSLIGMPYWKELHDSTKPDDYGATTLGFACVDFKFPETVRYPVLPIRTQNGLVFPLEGRSHCAAPEIVAALELGADITIRHGVVVPTNPNVLIFGDLFGTA
jgi:hypothetical protein